MRSFRDIVVSAETPVPLQAHPSDVEKPPPRIELRSVIHVPTPAKKGPDAKD